MSAQNPAIRAVVTMAILAAAPGAPTGWWAADAPAANDTGIALGQALHLTLPAGKPNQVSLVREFRPVASGPVTIDAGSQDFDTALKLFRIGLTGEATQVGDDNDGGPGSDSRIVADVEAGGIYRIEIRAHEDDWGGECDLSVREGRTEKPDFKAEQVTDQAYWKAVEEHARQSGNRLREAQSYGGQADVFVNRESFADALPLNERMMAMHQEILGPDGPRIAQDLNNIAYVKMRLGARDEAKTLFERALAINEKALGPEDKEVAFNLTNLAGLYHEEGVYDQSRPRFERALEIFQKQVPQDDDNLALGLNNVGTLQYDAGLPAEARPLFEQALALWEKSLGPTHPRVAIALNNLATVLDDLSDYVEARTLYDRALAIDEKQYGPDHPQTSLILASIGTLEYNMGAFAEAITFHERALKIREEKLGPDHPAVAVALENLGQTLRRMDRVEEARPKLERALAIFKKAYGPDHPRVANICESLAVLDQAKGEFIEARGLYEQSLAIREKALGADHPDVALTLHNLGTVLLSLHATAEARPMFERALAISVKRLGEEHPTTAIHLQGLALADAILGNTAQAVDEALRAESSRDAYLRLVSGALSERQALLVAANKSRTLDLALSLAVTDVSGIPEAGRKIGDAVIRSRALVLDEMANRRRILPRGDDPETEALTEAYRSASRRLAGLAVAQARDGLAGRQLNMLDEARRDREAAERALGQKSVAFRQRQEQEATGVKEIVESLPPGAALVSFVRFSSRSLAAGKETESSVPVDAYIALLLRAGTTDPTFVPLGPAAPIDDLVARWRAELGGGAQVSERRCNQVGAELRKRIWDPLAGHLEGAMRVFIVPDGTLNLIPFAALPTDDGRYLVETGPLLHLLSAERDLLRGAAPRPAGAGLLALGAPDFDASGAIAAKKPKPGGTPGSSPVTVARLMSGTTGGAEATGGSTFRGEGPSCADFRSVRFGPLGGTARELNEVVSLWSGAPAVRLTGAAATEAAFKADAPGRKVLHLATHGFFLGKACGLAPAAGTRSVAGLVIDPDGAPPPIDEENPLRLSGLALAGANRRGPAEPDAEDGILTAEEVAAMDLSQVEWAVLSACDTGVGEVQEGEGVFGLRRAFRVAGAGTVIMSLWSVDDDSTRRWMKELYQGRLKRGLDTAEAVQAASREVLRARRARKESTHPFYWAAFVAAGDWR